MYLSKYILEIDYINICLYIYKCKERDTNLKDIFLLYIHIYKAMSKRLVLICIYIFFKAIKNIFWRSNIIKIENGM